MAVAGNLEILKKSSNGWIEKTPKKEYTCIFVKLAMYVSMPKTTQVKRRLKWATQ
jgi:hypothetical protein